MHACALEQEGAARAGQALTSVCTCLHNTPAAVQQRYAEMMGAHGRAVMNVAPPVAEEVRELAQQRGLPCTCTAVHGGKAGSS